jgi:hypothetical protein
MPFMIFLLEHIVVTVQIVRSGDMAWLVANTSVRSVAGESGSGDSGRRSQAMVWSRHVVLCGRQSSSHRLEALRVREEISSRGNFLTNP